uniref:Glycosyl transferase family 3 N-terminal domain-containing protein n=1 Tax=Oryza meridionalis TaxID=40149 RepID=A0A0E0CN10_9ORYZ
MAAASLKLSYSAKPLALAPGSHLLPLRAHHARPFPTRLPPPPRVAVQHTAAPASNASPRTASFDKEEAEATLRLLLEEENEAHIAAFLVLLRAKGETYEERRWLLFPRSAAADIAGGVGIVHGETYVDGITAIYNLGDSLSDTGNLARQGATGGLLRYTTRLPYGVTVGRATGRCSDGYLIIDFLARDLGLPLLNPCLDEGADFAHGVNFAVAGATALNTTALAARGITVPLTNSSLDVQLRWFKEFMNSTTSFPQEIREKLSKSLVMLGEIGGNDYNYAFLQTWPMDGGYSLGNITRMIESVATAVDLVPEVVQCIANAAKEVLDMGATRVVIPGNFPLGCVPSYMSAVNVTDRAAYDARGCLVALNLFAALHNAWLRRAVGELRRAYRGAAVVAYADYSAATLDDAAALGFDERRVFRACCGVGGKEGGAYGFDVRAMCGAPGTAACADPGRYVSWDGVHLTQRAYGVMAELLFRRGLVHPPPINFTNGARA